MLNLGKKIMNFFFTHRGQDKMVPFCRWHLQIHFHEWKFLYFDSSYAEVFFPRVQLTIISIGSDHGLAPKRWQAIIRTDGDLVELNVYASLGLNVLKDVIMLYVGNWFGCFKSMAQCKTAVTPLLTHWSYCSLALSHRRTVVKLKNECFCVVIKLWLLHGNKVKHNGRCCYHFLCETCIINVLCTLRCVLLWVFDSYLWGFYIKNAQPIRVEHV